MQIQKLSKGNAREYPKIEIYIKREAVNADVEEQREYRSGITIFGIIWIIAITVFLCTNTRYMLENASPAAYLILGLLLCVPGFMKQKNYAIIGIGLAVIVNATFVMGVGVVMYNKYLSPVEFETYSWFPLILLVGLLVTFGSYKRSWDFFRWKVIGK